MEYLLKFENLSRRMKVDLERPLIQLEGRHLDELNSNSDMLLVGLDLIQDLSSAATKENGEGEHTAYPSYFRFHPDCHQRMK